MIGHSLGRMGMCFGLSTFRLRSRKLDGAETRLESSIKKFRPQLIYDLFIFSGSAIVQKQHSVRDYEYNTEYFGASVGQYPWLHAPKHSLLPV